MQDRLNRFIFWPIDQNLSWTIYEYPTNLKADSPMEIPQCFWPLKVERRESRAEARYFSSTQWQTQVNCLITSIKDHFTFYRTTTDTLKHSSNKCRSISNRRIRTLITACPTRPNHHPAIYHIVTEALSQDIADPETFSLDSWALNPPTPPFLPQSNWHFQPSLGSTAEHKLKPKPDILWAYSSPIQQGNFSEVDGPLLPPTLLPSVQNTWTPQKYTDK